MYYSSFGILALVLLFIINYDVLVKRDPREETPARRAYRWFLLSLTVYYLSDILWGILYEGKCIPLVYADTVVYFAAMVVSVLFWARFIVAYLGERGRVSRILFFAGWLILVFEIISLVVNFFVPTVFWFDGEGVYLPGPARYIVLALQALMFLAASVYSLAVASQTGGRVRLRHRTVCISGIVMTVFIVLQTEFPFLPFYAVGCMLGTAILHAFVLEDEKEERKKALEELLDREKRQRAELGSARQLAYTDSLTGVKNKHAFVEAEQRLDERISSGELEELGVIVFDLNGLKLINDTKGHEEGDRYIRSGCMLICHTFKHSPVFRIGGDEFVALLEGEDYRNRSSLLSLFDSGIEENLRSGAVVIASGLDEYRKGEDRRFRAVLERADIKMYARKSSLKKLAQSPV